jgi:predicted transcriptional regulator
MRSFTVRIPKELRRELEKLSRRKRRSLSDIVRDSLRRYVVAQAAQNLRDRMMPPTKS